MVFLGHLFIALIFIIGLYVAVTYTNLNLEIEDVKNLRRKMQGLFMQRKQALGDLAKALSHSPMSEKIGLSAMQDLLDPVEINDFAQQIAVEQQITQLANALLCAPELAAQANGNAEIQTLQQVLDSCQRQLAYTQTKYNAAVELYHHHKKSPYAKVVIKLWKHLDQEYGYA